jgi:energy-coupling factor transporter ATP-binding protein EcfA2
VRGATVARSREGHSRALGTGARYDRRVNRPYVERLRIQNFGCITDATFNLTPLHALIGPNDSGKSTVLRAIAALSVWATNNFNVNDLSPTFAAYSAGRAPRLEVATSHAVAHVGIEAGRFTQSPETAIRPALDGCQLLRLDPDVLRKPSTLIPDGQALRLTDERGEGLPGVYDAIITRDVEAYVAISNHLTELFPNVKSLSLKNPTYMTKALGVQLRDGTFVPAATMSEGLLYWLAFAALRHLQPTALILLEEPENGLHPARIRDVVKLLRDISQNTQVILATHSPLVINELEPHEVSVVTRGANGTTATVMKDTPDFAERSKVYSLGELWVSYANGDDEAPLLAGGRRS